MKLNSVQKAAYELIQSDARFLYTLTVIQREANNISSNYIMMSQPYIGLFTDGAEQWCKKLKLDAPNFTEKEKRYYTDLRQSHKLYDKSYMACLSVFKEKLHESDTYFYNIPSPLKKLVGYNNVGTDLCNGEFCGNTVLCALYTPVNILNNKEIGLWIKEISIIAGKLAAFFGCTDYYPYKYDNTINVKYKDYHFYRNCPIKIKTDLGFLLFSILCSVNYVIEFVDRYFVDEIPQKFKFAYLQYYYLCSFLEELNIENGTNYFLNNSLRNRSLRNCLAHYGLGQYISEKDLRKNDPLKGLTIKAFDMEYSVAKENLYIYLKELIGQIKNNIF